MFKSVSKGIVVHIINLVLFCVKVVAISLEFPFYLCTLVLVEWLLATLVQLPRISEFVATLPIYGSSRSLTLQLVVKGLL